MLEQPKIRYPGGRTVAIWCQGLVQLTTLCHQLSLEIVYQVLHEEDWSEDDVGNCRALGFFLQIFLSAIFAHEMLEVGWIL